MKAKLLRNITAGELAMDSTDEGYSAEVIIGSKGSEVTIVNPNDWEEVSIEVTDFDNDPYAIGFVNRRDLEILNPIIESPSGWSYRESQENGDNVDCQECGNPLNDDLPIVNDSGGFAYHERCLPMPLSSAIDGDNPLFTWMDRVKERYQTGEITPGEQITSPFGIHGTYESVDEDGDVYLMVGFVLPDSWYAEIEDGTYGQLQGFRIYKETEID